jgi:hypothetical protein
VAVGTGIILNSTNSCIIGSGTVQISSDGAVALGTANDLTGINAVALGYGNTTGADYSIAIGTALNPVGEGTICVGASFSDATVNSFNVGWTSRVFQVTQTEMTYGDGTNYFKTGADGTVTLHGTATAFEDLRIEPTARTSGTNAPTFEKWLDDSAGTSRGVYLYSFDDAAANAEKEIFFTMQVPHNYKLGGAINIHVHWIGNNADTAAAPRWGLEYAWKDIGEVFADTVIVYSDGSNYTASGTDANVSALKHYISKFAAITPGTTEDGMSSILIGRIFRNSSAAGDTYDVASNKCGLLYIDAHYEIDSFGSSSEYTK